jgi:hypothetical protein
LARNGADKRDGPVAGWPKSSQRENKSDGDVELERMRGLVLAVLTKGFFLWSHRGCNGHRKPPEVSGDGNTGFDNGQPVRSQRRDRGRGQEMAE